MRPVFQFRRRCLLFLFDCAIGVAVRSVDRLGGRGRSHGGGGWKGVQSVGLWCGIAFHDDATGHAPLSVLEGHVKRTSHQQLDRVMSLRDWRTTVRVGEGPVDVGGVQQVDKDAVGDVACGRWGVYGCASFWERL